MRKIFTFLTCLAFSSFVLSQVTPEIQWAKTYGGSEAESAEQIIQTTDGGYIFAGYTMSSDGDVSNLIGMTNYWVVKTNADGTIEWERTYGGTLMDMGSAVKQTPDGGYIIGGSIYSDDGDITENNSELWMGQDFWLVKIDSEGEIEWENNYGGTYEEILKDLQLTSDGGYIAIGTTMSKSGDVSGGYGIEGNFFQEGWVVKIDSEGEIEWQRPYGAYEGFVEFRNIEQTTDGGYIIGGNTGYGFDGDHPPTHAGSSDFWALKIDATGDIEWSKVFGGSKEDYSGKITQVSDGGYLFVGGIYSTDGDVIAGPPNGNTDGWILKLSNDGELEWQKTITGTGGDGATRAYETADNNFVIAGATFSSDGDFTGFPNNGNANHFLMKLDSTDGNIIWTKTMGGNGMDVLLDFQKTSDGGFITLGSTLSNDGDVVGNHGQSDIWVVKLSPDCLVPELTVDTMHTICAGEELILTTDAEAELINWYDAADATEPIFTGTEFELPALTETTSYWVEAANYICKSDRIEIVITVNPLPILEAETTYAICSENPASLYASSPNNVIFWYANEDDTEYLYHGNLFVTEELTENTTFWVEAYNLSTGCTSERIEVTVNVSEALPAPIADDTQEFVAGMTLADLIVEHTAPLTWYADAQLTQELPETTLVVVGTTYYVTQSGVGCESASTAILVDTFLGNGNLNSDKFAYYPNPVKDVLNFKGNETVKSVQIYDLSGKLILNQNSNSISSVNLNSLPKGTYVVKATTDKKVNTFKIVKN